MTQIKCEHCGAVYEVDLKEKKILALNSSSNEITEIPRIKRKYKKRAALKGQGSKKTGRPKVKHGPIKARKQNKYPQEMESFVRKHMQDFPNNELVTLVKKEFNLRITKPQLAAYMNYNDLKRRKGAVKELEHDGNGKILPPEDDY